MMKNIDDIFKNNLDNHGLSYNEAHWEDMEELLDKEPKKKPLLYWRYLVAFFLGIGVCLIAVLLVPTKKTNQVGVNNSKAKIILTDKQEKQVDSLTKNKSIINSNEANQKEPFVSVNSAQMIGTRTTPLSKILNEPSYFSPGNPISNNSQINSVVENNSIQTLEEAIPNVLDLKLWQLNLKKNFEAEASMAIHCSSCKLKPIAKQTLVTDSIKPKQQWSYFMSFTTQYDRYERENNNNALKKDEQTLNRLGYNISIAFREQHWGFRTGIGLLRLAENTNYRSVNSSYSVDTVYRMVNPNFGVSPTGNTVALIKRQLDTTTTQWTTVKSPNAKVQFSYIKVPMIASFAWGNKGVRLYFDAGLSAAIRVKNSGTYTQYENGHYSLTNLKANNITNPVLFQTYTAIGVSVKLTKYLNITNSYGVSKGLNSMMKGYVQKPNTKFINFGLELKL